MFLGSGVPQKYEFALNAIPAWQQNHIVSGKPMQYG